MKAFDRWQLLIVWLSLIAIVLYIFLQLVQPSIANFPLITIAIFGGIPLIFQITYKLLNGDLGADSLAAIALITAIVLQQYLAAILIILMLASGQTLESYAIRKASSVLQALAERMPTMAHRKFEAEIKDIALADIRIGDTIVLYPHEVCPIDGTILEGHGTMDESYLTGEPYQISKAPGATALSGAVNGNAVLIIRTDKLPLDSRYAEIVKVLEEAEQKRPAMRRLGDQIGAIFAPIALIFALAVWYFTGEAIRFLAVLVIATPCPLLIAIPVTLISAISMAARRAIIIKEPTVLERLPTCRTAIFDKTGTLTCGEPTLTEILTDHHIEASFILQLVASLERYSKHPLAKAILRAAKTANLPLFEASSVTETPGEGLHGIIANHEIYVTHRKKLMDLDPTLNLNQIMPTASGGLECIVLLNGKYAATFCFHDAPRLDSKSFISHLGPAHQFKKIMLVSGDRASEVNYLAAQLNITSIYASQSPEQKLRIVRTETSKVSTLFMGDGINDAPALTAATVGLAFGQYSAVTAAAAGAVIMENTLTKVDELIHLSIVTRQIALQSAVGGMLLSLIGMSFAAAGYISPVTGAILQEVIDVLAILNALRLTWGSKVTADLSQM